MTAYVPSGNIFVVDEWTSDDKILCHRILGKIRSVADTCRGETKNCGDSEKYEYNALIEDIEDLLGAPNSDILFDFVNKYLDQCVERNDSCILNQDLRLSRLLDYFEEQDSQAISALDWMRKEYAESLVLDITDRAHKETSGESTSYGITVKYPNRQRISPATDFRMYSGRGYRTEVATVADTVWLIYDQYKKNPRYSKMPLDWQFEIIRGL